MEKIGKHKPLLKKAAFPPPPRLLDLARIKHFDLFVSITFDSLLADAINTVRFGGNARTEEIAYSPNDVQDLRIEKKGPRSTSGFPPPGQALRVARLHDLR